MDSAAFDRLVAAAYERIPARFRRRLKNIAVMVEAEPTQAQLERSRVPQGGTLLGLYEGRPLTARPNGAAQPPAAANAKCRRAARRASCRQTEAS